MKYCITGGAGNISKPLVRYLLKANHQVRVIARTETHLKDLVASGAEAAIGSIEDLSFLEKSFTGVDAVYTMCPPNFSPEGFVAFAEKISRNYRNAIAASGVQYVVNLSSVGAHLTEGAGHITGLNKMEQQLNSLEDVAIQHLRPVYFYTNLFSQIDLIQNLAIMGTNFSSEINKFPLVHPSDIAAVAAEKLQSLNFSGTSVEYVASDERTTSEIASILGKAIGKPELQWVKFTDEQVLKALIQSGIPSKAASELVEGFHAIDTGKVLEDYWINRGSLGKIKLEEFALQFAAAYLGDTKIHETSEK